MKWGMDKGITGPNFISEINFTVKAGWRQRKLKYCDICSVIRACHYSVSLTFQLISAELEMCLYCTDMVITGPSVLYAVCLLSFSSWCPVKPDRPAGRELPGSCLGSSLPLLTRLGRERRPGLYGDEWMKKSKPQQALLYESIKRSGGTAGALIMRQTQEGQGAGLRGENTRAHDLIKRH